MMDSPTKLPLVINATIDQVRSNFSALSLEEQQSLIFSSLYKSVSIPFKEITIIFNRTYSHKDEFGIPQASAYKSDPFVLTPDNTRVTLELIDSSAIAYIKLLNAICVNIQKSSIENMINLGKSEEEAKNNSFLSSATFTLTNELKTAILDIKWETH